MSGNYNWLGLYNEQADPRIIVPKRNRMLGWTLNVGHAKGQAALIAVIFGVLLAAAFQYS